MRTTHARIIDARKNKALAEKEIARAIRSGAVIVYPTDTVYGVGCDARCAAAVRRIRALKGRSFAKPFSVIAPNKKWIQENCALSPQAAEFLAKKMPEPYTMILRLKNKRCVDRT
ncbi:MAG: Sua5/YciO/YrdC/YwlC family protein, partial [Candidatus Micrarchaeota archaeon]